MSKCKKWLKQNNQAFHLPARMACPEVISKNISGIIASGSINWPASSIMICVKWPFGKPILYKRPKLEHVDIVTLCLPITDELIPETDAT